MKNDCFLDTNILIYALAGRRDDPEKFEIAQALFMTRDFCLSGQVLAEFYVNASSRLGKGVTLDEIGRWMDALSAFPVLPVDTDLVRGGIAFSHRYKISYWDGAIIAAAERLGATTLYTEDLNHRQTYGSVTAINPFRAN